MPVRRFFFARWLACLGVWLFGLPALFASTNQHVVLITIDGLANSYLSDPEASLPTLRKLASQGARAGTLRVCNPTTTWPNHTTLTTGVTPVKHSVLFNGLLIRGGPGWPVHIEGDHDQKELVAVPTVYDLLHSRGLRTAAINWPCTRGAITLDDNFPDTPARLRYTTPRLRAELIRDGILGSGDESALEKMSAAAHDQMWLSAAMHVLKRRPPALLLLHLLAGDVIQHRYGPRTPAAYTALALADAQVGQLVIALEEDGLLAQTTLMVASDHGFARPLKLINPNVVLRKAGLLRPGPRRVAQSVSEGGIAFVYLTQPTTAAADGPLVISLLRGVEGIAEVREPSQYAPLRLPTPGSAAAVGDLLLIAKKGYVFSDDFFDDEVITPIPMALGSHGFLASDPEMDGVLIVAGPNIRAGTDLGIVDNVDVAPTIAALFGQKLAGATGKVLTKLVPKGWGD